MPTSTAPGCRWLTPTTCARVFGNSLRSRDSPVARFTEYRWKFSSPPVSRMYSSVSGWWLQKYWRMPRALSEVTARALAVSPAGAIQTFITPSTAATQLRYLPSGLICTLVRSGLPNNASRGISSTSLIDAGAAAGAAAWAVGSVALRSQAESRQAAIDVAMSVRCSDMASLRVIPACSIRKRRGCTDMPEVRLPRVPARAPAGGSRSLR